MVSVHQNKDVMGIFPSVPRCNHMALELAVKLQVYEARLASVVGPRLF